MSKLFWSLLYTLSCALVAFFLTAGATYWNWEIGAYAGAGGAVFGFLGYLLVRYGPKRRDSRDSFIVTILENYEAILDLGVAWRNRTKEAEELLGRVLAYLAHKPFDSITVRELYDDIQKHFAKVEEANRDREEDSDQDKAA